MRRPARSSPRSGRSAPPSTRCSPAARRSRCPGESNKSTDLIARINRAKPAADRPRRRPGRASSRCCSARCRRKPENRQASVLEFIRELQAVETELGVPQTPVEVAMDDWALATVADLEDRTRIRPASPSGTVVAAPAPAARGGRVGDATAASAPLDARHERGPRSTATRAPWRRGSQLLAWIARRSRRSLVIALGATATLVLIQAADGRHPGGDRHRGRPSSDTTSCSPGTTRGCGGDTYQIDDERRPPSIQRSSVVHAWMRSPATGSASP